MSVKSDRNRLNKLNDIVYSKIDPHERFKMVIKASAQGDDVQREKIVKSCPMFNYLLSDNMYTDRVETSKDIVSIFLIQLLEYYNVISTMKLSELINQPNQNVRDANQLIQIQSFLIAFEEFCIDYLEIETIVLIQAWHGYDDRFIDKIHEMKQYLSINQVEFDEVSKEQWLNNTFIYNWRKRILK